jgi:predicted RNase H-like HicB family nuclease
MRSFVEQNTSGNQRDFAVVPDEKASERSLPSERSVPGRHRGQIVYSQAQYETAYSMRSAPSFDLGFQRTDEGYWLVWDRPTGVFGEGDTPLDAMKDFERTAARHLAVLERQRDSLPEGQAWQLAYLNERVQR